MSEFPRNGTYSAFLRSKMVVKEFEEGGAIAVDIPFTLCIDPPFHGEQRVWLTKKNGELVERNLKRLAIVFKWDGLNFFDLEDIEPPLDNRPQFELQDCYVETYTPKATETEPFPQEQKKFVGSWFNELGGQKLDDDAKERIKKKFGSKLRAAMGGGGTVKKTTNDEPEEEPMERPRKGESAITRTSSQQEAWEALEKKEKPKDRAAKEKLKATFWEKVDELFADKDPLTPQDWGKVATTLGV